MSTIRNSLIKLTDKVDQLVPKVQDDDNESTSSVSNHVSIPVSSSRDEPLQPFIVQPADLERSRQQLRFFISLYNDVLVQEWTPDHASMLHSRDREEKITCDFCTCDVFQSFFECQSLDNGLIICPPCYVEGRACKCGSMTPMQYYRFDELLQDRERALEVLLRAEPQSVFKYRQRFEEFVIEH
jgi:hypothetical protein